jgi:hypothetical protein
MGFEPLGCNTPFETSLSASDYYGYDGFEHSRNPIFLAFRAQNRGDRGGVACRGGWGRPQGRE